MSDSKYRNNFYYEYLSPEEKKRCLNIPLRGLGEFVNIAAVNPHIRLLPEHVEYYFGAQNIRVMLSSLNFTSLDHWLDLTPENILYNHKFLGVAGPEGSTLYLVIKKEFLL